MIQKSPWTVSHLGLLMFCSFLGSPVYWFRNRSRCMLPHWMVLRLEHYSGLLHESLTLCGHPLTHPQFIPYLPPRCMEDTPLPASVLNIGIGHILWCTESSSINLIHGEIILSEHSSRSCSHCALMIAFLGAMLLYHIHRQACPASRPNV